MKGAADNSLELLQLLQQLQAVKKSAEVAVIVGINIRAENIPLSLQDPGITTAVGWTTLFYSLEAVGNGCRFRFICEKQTFKLAVQADVADFFKNSVLSLYMADRYILFTWDHGQPFGIFPDTGKNLMAAVTAEAKAKTTPATFHFRLLEQLEQEGKSQKNMRRAAATATEDDLPILTITELRQAIEWAFGDDKIDVLVMANCYLQFFDTGYELSSCVDYLIAFQTEMFFRDAFDYTMILEAISNDPLVMPENLSKAIVSSYALQRTQRNQESMNSVALFANNLSWYPVVAKLIDQLAIDLIREMPRYRDRIMKAIEECEYISPNIPAFCLIDFRNFLRCLHNELPSLFSVIPYEYFETILRELVTASHIGHDFVNEMDIRFRAPSCFSMYLPKKLSDYRTSFLSNFMLETSLSPTLFVKRFSWEMFIYQFIQPSARMAPAAPASVANVKKVA
ncbi:clostripain-related cysteine peptidase [Dawidia soli]|uniref:Uncharacterized protein n=1 Tax=Dawidia soli TaxID=2782352 RepID=A0AAP2D7R4_9BACT|nr:clostripain-related cysteine peptidase [Dawidia soli]MBT1685575.1 hypothetical protein [Dawidia soli]